VSEDFCEYHNCLKHKDLEGNFVCDLCSGEEAALAKAERRGAERMLEVFKSGIVSESMLYWISHDKVIDVGIIEEIWEAYDKLKSEDK
jgi:hypothetical protein